MRLSCSRRRPPSLGFFLSPLRRDREHFPGGQRRVKSVTSAGRGPPRLCDPGLALPPPPCLPGGPKNSWLITSSDPDPPRHRRKGSEPENRPLVWKGVAGLGRERDGEGQWEGQRHFTLDPP